MDVSFGFRVLVLAAAVGGGIGLPSERRCVTFTFERAGCGCCAGDGAAGCAGVGGFDEEAGGVAVMAGDGGRCVGGACFGFMVCRRTGRLVLSRAGAGRGRSGSAFGCRGGDELEVMRSVERRGRSRGGCVVCCEERVRCDREGRLRSADSFIASLSTSSKIWISSRCIAGTCTTSSCGPPSPAAGEPRPSLRFGGEDGGKFSCSSSSSAAFLFLDADESCKASPPSSLGLESMARLIESSISLSPDSGSSTAFRCCTICNKLGCLARLLNPDICKNDGVACARDPDGG